MKLDRIRLRHLKMLVALREYKKVSLVAEAFGLSQPSLSRLLSDLEYRAGVKLFERHNRGTMLTAEGEILARYAQMMLTDLAKAEYEVRAVASGARGRVAIGSIMTPAYDVILPAVTRVFEDHPHIDINIVFDSSDALLDRVRSRELDFAVCRYTQKLAAEHYEFNYWPLGDDTLRMVTAPSHELADRKLVGGDDLVNLNWVLQPKGTPLRKIVDAYHHKKSIVPNSIVSTSSELFTLLLVTRSDRVGIFPSKIAELFDQHGLVRALAMDPDLKLPEFGLVWPIQRELSHSANVVVETIRSYRKVPDLGTTAV